MKTYWTSGVMVEVDPRPGELVYYRKDEVDAREQQATAMIQAQRRKIEDYERRLRRINEINDDPAVFNCEIEELSTVRSDQSNGDL